MPTDYRSMYEKDYLGAWDFTDGDKTFTIKKCQRGELVGSGGRKSKKPVVYFQESDKGLALNATNGKTIAALYGVMVEEWTGKKITLYRSRTTMGSEEVDCVRVRPQKPKGGPSLDDEPEPTLTEEQQLELHALCTEGGRDLVDELKSYATLDALADLPQRHFNRAKNWIKQKRVDEQAGQAAGS